MIKCPYCEEVFEEPDEGMTDACPNCFVNVSSSEWIYLHAE
jgi:predicted  nucleic acid-binding Zn-ribbon protein